MTGRRTAATFWLGCRDRESDGNLTHWKLIVASSVALCAHMPAVLTPRWLLLDGEEDNGAANPATFRFGYRDRELAGKSTRQEPIVALRCHVDGAPAVVHVLGFRPTVAYRVGVRHARLCAEMGRLKADLNASLHARFAARPELAAPDAVYVVECRCEPAGDDASTLSLRICRPSDVRPYYLTAALTRFLSGLGADGCEVKLLSGEPSYGRLQYTDVTAAVSFKEAFGIRYDTVLHAEDLIPRPDANGTAVYYVQAKDLAVEPATRERTLAFFSNTVRGTFDKKVFDRECKSYSAEAMAERDRQQALLDDAAYARHAQEYLLRIVWNLRHGVTPAHQKIHLADPGRVEASDARFAFGVAPFHVDGTPNPLGIPDNRGIETHSHALD